MVIFNNRALHSISICIHLIVEGSVDGTLSRSFQRCEVLFDCLDKLMLISKKLIEGFLFFTTGTLGNSALLQHRLNAVLNLCSLPFTELTISSTCKALSSSKDENFLISLLSQFISDIT